MTKLNRWDPFAGSALMDEMVRGLFPAAQRTAATNGRWAPRCDVREQEDAYLIHAELPGLNPAELELTFQGDTLTLQGEKKAEEKQEGVDYHVVERTYGSFRRSFSFPSAVEPDGVEADFEHGVLTIRVPKAGESRPKRIEVKTRD